MQYYEINEQTARRANDVNSIRDYLSSLVWDGTEQRQEH